MSDEASLLFFLWEAGRAGTRVPFLYDTGSCR